MVRQPTSMFSLSFLMLGHPTWSNPSNGNNGQVSQAVQVQLRPWVIGTPTCALSGEETEAPGD